MPQLDLKAFQKGRNLRDEADVIDNALEVEDPTVVDLKPIPFDREDGQEPAVPSLPVQVAPPEPRLPFGPLRHLDPKRLNTRAQLMEQLTAIIPLNELDQPLYIYRPDLLNPADFHPLLLSDPTKDAVEGMQDKLAAAVMQLSYHEGFPTTPQGLPLWQQLPFEPKESFDAFTNYLELGGARQIHQLVAYDLDEVRENFHLYYWSFRVRAYDLWKVAHHQKVKLQRLLETEDSHYRLAEKLLKRIAPRLENITDEDLEAMDPETALNMLDKLMKIQRISIGLPANGSIKESEPQKMPETSVILQQVVQSSGGGVRKNKVDDEIDLLTEDPDAVDLAQQLIIKVQGGQK